MARVEAARAIPPLICLGALFLWAGHAAAGHAIAQSAPEPGTRPRPASTGRVHAEGVAALVGGTSPGPTVAVILHSDVLLRARIRLGGSRTPNYLTGPVEPTLLEQTLDELIGEILIAREAERVQVASPTEVDVGRERRRLADMAGGPARLARLLEVVGAPPSEVDAMARRRATVRAFLEANLEGAAVVGEAEIERAYAAGDHPFIGQPLEEVREAMRVILVRKAVDEAVRRWVTVLRSRTPVRVLARYGATGG